MKKGLMFVLMFLLVFLLVFSSFVSGAGGELAGEIKHIKLLAVQEEKGEYKGSIADLYLELKEGSGRVFLETFPLTKMDTQISTRFAKEIACDYFKLDCSKYDFIYTIKAETNIIGGPSAGAAISALTVVSLLELEYDDTATITGTINSGGIVGQVGGVKEKLEAAANNSLRKVLVAKGSGSLKRGEETFDLIKYARENLSLEVKEAEDLNEVVFELSGKRLKEDRVVVEISTDYQEIMEELSRLLCGRTEELERELKGFVVKEEEMEEIREKKNSSKESLERRDYYSAASFCFGANILIDELIYEKKEVGQGWILYELKTLGEKTKLMEERLGKEKIETISDLQTLMVVKERLEEVKERIRKFEEESDKRYALAYMEERFFSAVSWMYFFKMEGKAFVFDSEKLKDSCMKKISESEERYQYVELIFGGFNIGYIAEKIEQAKKSLGEGEYDLCLIKAAQGKAEANAVLSSMGLDEEGLEGFLESKRKAVEKVISENSAEGVFPILGYSYYEYANSLVGEKSTALLYLEYALEMSELDIYFEEERGFYEGKGFFGGEIEFELGNEWVIFMGGFLAGGLVVMLVWLGRKLILGRKKKGKRRREIDNYRGGSKT